MKNYIDFIGEATSDNNLAKEYQSLIQNSDAVSLSNWFSGKGYAVNENECGKIINSKNNMKSARIGYIY